MRRLIVAIGFLTRLPTPRVTADEADFAGSMRWFPAVGLVVGGLVALAGWAGALVDPWVGALGALAAWVLVTGVLHLDGLSDLADALGAGHGDRERFLAVMADPHVGSFGVTAIVLQLLAKLVLLHALVDAPGLLVLAPFVARIGPIVWTCWLPPLHGGLAARFAGSVRWGDGIAWMIPLLVAAWWIPALLAAPLLVGLWGLWLKRALGGVSGDCHGAGIELVETGLLLALAVGRL